ncbi:MAG: radical SAM protein [Candidatus Bathyarchaeia archaeon]
MGKCLVCGAEAKTISNGLRVCLSCIRNKPEKALVLPRQVHAENRAAYGLPPEPTRDAGGVPCGVCANNCVIGEGNVGFCGLVKNVDGRLIRFGGTAEHGVLEWCYDPLPTNCVGWRFCPGCTGSGYPKYAYKPAAERGYVNLAIFYGACSYNCLFCQNLHYRKLSARQKPAISADALAAKVDSNVSCICYFGGDPSPQMPHSLEVSRLAIEKARAENRILRVCWETNGYLNPKMAEKAVEYALESGGKIKFDLKAWNEVLSITLCGVSNKPSFASFKLLGEKYYKKRRELPVLAASTLLVPGYIDTEEVEHIARFVGEIDPDIPYTLLAFYPCFVMYDLPTTSRKQALECQEAAEKHLSNVKLGNVHLLS